jgi:lipoprotein-anchoring transpeptidase ErfK/SrfK
VSTGGPGSETPVGTYAVQARQRTGQAEDAPTVHMDYFTVFNGDIGFHGIPWAGDRANPLWTPLGEAAVSHGCVRMDDANARVLYTFLPDGAQVVVQD